MKTYNVGIIGAGFMGKVHALGWTDLPFFYRKPGFKSVLKTICDARKEAADEAREELGFERSMTDFRAMIEDPDIDVIDVCCPNHLHREILLVADHAGKPVYCEKPLTGNLEEALLLEKELVSPDSLGQVTLEFRFYPATLRARQMIEEGAIGDIISFRAAYLHSGNVAPGKQMHWKDMRSFGGGVLYDLGSHVLDLMTWLCGDSLASVFALQKTLHPLRPSYEDAKVLAKQESDDMTLMAVTFSKGAVGSIEASKVATGAQDELRFEIHGTKGALRVNMMQPNYLEYFEGENPETPLGGTSGFKRIHCVQRYDPPGGFPGPKFSIGWLRGHLHCLYHFIDSHHAGRPFDPSIQRGIEIEKMLAAVEQSARTGEVVKL